MLTQRIPRPDYEREKNSTGHGEVKVYYLTKEELEKYRNLPKPTDREGRPLRKTVGIATRW